MYQRRTRQMLIFLVVTFLAIRIPPVVFTAIQTQYTSGEEYVLVGAHVCGYGFQGDAMIRMEIAWILATAWEFLALFLAICIAIKHFREMQRPSSGWTVGDCFTILIKTHVIYFASYAAASSLETTRFSRQLNNSTSMAAGIFAGIFEFTRACRCLYWDHGSFLQFENIMLTSSPAPMKQLAWLRLFSRSTYTFQLAMVCSR
ncbi:hypothetical protein K503DRAFT_75956 [Rhizopogon vinicolor AM-OR11-026]|uniref:Uncharacterized protein n=1 Tax=Rhizopogon vinicolor AM-OR11-026 TaxID=1314800 RepID=A0A1B7MG13_9AGAM|nr:hypothetical protein K503DRAFT_75956 [Rhizopogon vinicolor AM-OR11-026]